MTDDLVTRLRLHAESADINNSVFEEAADAIETLTRERDEAHQRYVDANEARIDAEALLREAGKALEPFSAWCDSMEEFAKGLSNGLSDEARLASDLTMGDARRARAVLARIKEAVE